MSDDGKEMCAASERRQENPQATVVVVACGGEGELAARALDSVAAQAQLGVEVIVVVRDDDARMRALACAWARTRAPALRVRIELIPPDPSPSPARKRGLALATAPYVLFMDGDDFFCDPGSLARLACELDARPSCAVVAGRYELRWDDGRPPRPSSARGYGRELTRAQAFGRIARTVPPPMIGSALFRREALVAGGALDAVVLEHLPLLFRALLGGGIYLDPAVIAVYWQRAGSLSRSMDEAYTVRVLEEKRAIARRMNAIGLNGRRWLLRQFRIGTSMVREKEGKHSTRVERLGGTTDSVGYPRCAVRSGDLLRAWIAALPTARLRMRFRACWLGVRFRRAVRRSARRHSAVVAE